MSIVSAERRVALCKEQLRLAYEALREERERDRVSAYQLNSLELRTANEKLERFCLDYFSRNLDEYGLKRLQLRSRFVMCALASGMQRRDIAAMLPKVSGKGSFVCMGVTRTRVHSMIVEARYALQRFKPTEVWSLSLAM
jgi:hypothetical protein